MHIRQLILGSILALNSQVFAQRIETSRASRDQIIHVETSLNHLTVIEVSEPVTMVAVGSPSFKVERRDNKVFVQPLEEQQGTNLFIWTPTTRYNYELAPPGDVARMHFAVDHTTQDIQLAQGALETIYETARTQDPNTSVTRALMEMIPVKSQLPITTGDRVVVVVKDVFKMQDRLLIRYSIENHGHAAYHLESPQVVRLEEPRTRQSLIPLSLTQLNEKEADRLSKRGEAELEVLQTQATTTNIEPGQETVGVISLKPINNGDYRPVVQLRFPADQKGKVKATVVL